ncbi:MAG: lipoyl synthase [Phycisphaeraceae bacterium]|nr:lipoyl synthase [Phycisphaeraceae bacterium]
MPVSLSHLIIDNAGRDYIRRRKPDWLRARLPGGAGYQRLRSIIDEHRLHTVCESAKCPNMGECWSRGTATIMILGDVCTRSCGFCHIATGKPPEYDTDEPRRVAKTVALMRLRHIVITSVNRDELPDGGAALWAETIRRTREASPGTSIEVLIPDFCGNWDALQLVIDEKPEILNHNMETVRRLYRVVRPQAKYDRSIELLRRGKEQGLTTKTGIMVGIGETDDEVEEVMRDIVERSSCDILSVGQYLQPTRDHLPITRWVTPAQFAHYKEYGEALGFRHVESGPLVRSSYHAEDQALHLNDV